MFKSKPDRIHRIAIVGASGIVGQEAVSILESRGHPAKNLKLLGSDRSVGKSVDYLGSTIPIEHLGEITRSEHDFVLLCATSEVARNVRDALSNTSAVLIDNSSAFRMDPDVPLVIPEVNAHLLHAGTRLVANPNCSTIMLLVALNPLQKSFGVKSVVVTTYQAVSGAGAAGIAELHSQTRAYHAGTNCPKKIFPCSCAFNVFEHESIIDPATGFNGEETKIIDETQKIWDDSMISVLPTCVRVPVERTHSQSIIVELERSTTVEEIRQVFAGADGVELTPDGERLTPRGAAGKDSVFVGRIRVDPQSNGRRVILWVCADQIRKGAALNAIQILDMLTGGLQLRPQQT